MRKLIKSIIFIISMLYLFMGNSYATEVVSVFVSIAPQKYFLQQIGKNLVSVQTMVQPRFSSKSAKLVAREIGGQVAFADSLGEDWMANLRQVGDKFQAALK